MESNIKMSKTDYINFNKTIKNMLSKEEIVQL